MNYQIWSNVSMRRGRWFDGYEPQDAMKKSWEDTLPTASRDEHDVLESLFMKFNADDRPNGQTAHSLSVGDVVVLDGKAFAVAGIGYRPLEAFRPIEGDYER